MFKRYILISAFLFLCIFSVVAFGQNETFAQATDATKNITVQTIESQSLTSKIAHNLAESWPWYIARASGLIAGVTLIILMLSGIGQITGHTFKILSPIVAWASHRALGFVYAVSVLIHIISFLFDKYFKISFAELLVPWLSNYKPVNIFGINFGSLYLAFGIIAFYLSIAIVVSSVLIISKKPYFWKWIHISSYVLIAIVFFHALYLGTDLAHGVLRYLWIGGGITIAIASIVRLWRAYTT